MSSGEHLEEFGEGGDEGQRGTRQQIRRRKYEDAFQNQIEGEGQLEESKEEEEEDDSLEEHIVPQPTTQFDDLTSGGASNLDEVGDVDPKPEAAPIKVIPCGVHTCFQTFTTLQEYSNHYSRKHMYVCGSCKKSLPTSHILELHVLELHDTYFAMSALKKPMYSCLLETCNEKFQDVQLRKSHCLKEHKFPEKFQYWEFVKSGKKSGKSNKSKRKGKVDEHSKKGQPSETSTNDEKDSKIQTRPEKMSPDEVIMIEDGLPEKENSSVAVVPDDETTRHKPSLVPNVVRAKHLTFGRSAHKVFKNKYSFGLPKNPANVTQSSSNETVSTSTEETMDFTEVQKALVKLL